MNPEYSGDNTEFVKEFGKFNFSSPKTSINELYNWYKYDSKLIFNDKIFDNWIKN